MEEAIGKKRRLPLSDDDDSRRPPEKRKVRFPKGKKFKEALITSKEDEDESLIKPVKAAEVRATRRKLNRGVEVPDEEVQADISKAEIRYEEDVNFVEDGIQIEPFNLNKEREEGYFDENGNYVEYARGNEIEDAWLDSAEIDTKFASKLKEKAKDEEEEFQDLSSDDIGKIKRCIANILQPGETIIQALKRLKGTTDKHTKMSEETKEIFDKLTESAMKLMENGEYNVYHEERETFEREAVGYERLARARGGASGSATEEDIFAEEDGDDIATKDGSSSIWDVGPASSAFNVSSSAPPVASFVNDDGELDMFGDEDENTDPSKAQTENAEGSTDSDYVFDPSSGYYYSSSLGYYFDATSGLYCCASTGTWYSFDEQTGTYKEVESGTAPSGES